MIKSPANGVVANAVESIIEEVNRMQQTVNEYEEAKATLLINYASVRSRNTDGIAIDNASELTLAQLIIAVITEYHNRINNKGVK